jgi:aryl-alcohol dehydrogenase-like predicted oxidoreductase
MDDPRGLSPVGFGAYRAYAGVPKHERALELALALGCNLIDTAASYGAGSSEQLIGSVLRRHRGAPPYVMTKAGYGETGYSIEPGFLGVQLSRSLARLGPGRIGALLLHNPERWFEGRDPADRDGFDAAIERAFTFLEERVDAGAIGCYGVSSNTIALGVPAGPRLGRLLELARRVRSDPSFRILQLPFNLLEREAVELRHDGATTVALARDAGLRVVGNRPLNAMTPEGPLRLATYDDAPLDDRADARHVEAVTARIEERVGRLDADRRESALALIGWLRQNWDALPGQDLAEGLFAEQLWPLVCRLHGGAPPDPERHAYSRFHRILSAHARRNMSRRAQEVRARLIAEGRLPAGDPRPLAVLACAAVLDAGLDHVLVGMRDPRHVEAVSPLLDGRPTGAATV